MTSLSKSVFNMLDSIAKTAKDNPMLVPKLMLATAPVVAAGHLFNLEPTGEVIGEYLKNKLVPDLEEYNVARESELGGIKTMGERYMPEAAAMELLGQTSQGLKSQAYERAKAAIPGMVTELMTDPYLQNVSADRITSLLDDIARQAPNTVMLSPSTVKGIVRGAALTGSDTLDINTSKALLELEKEHVGR